MDLKKAIPYEPLWMSRHVPDEDDDEDYEVPYDSGAEETEAEYESPYDAYWNYRPMAVYDPE